MAYRTDPSTERYTYPAVPERPTTLATLSLFFAFIFAPLGAVLGHLALSHISRGLQQGRSRALLGISLSYIFILSAVLGLTLWQMTAPVAPPFVGANHDDTTAGVASLAPIVQTTVVTPIRPVRKTVHINDLRSGDCVELQQLRPEPGLAFIQHVNIIPVNCELRDGVFRVKTVSSSTGDCNDGFLANGEGTAYACISKFEG